MIDIPDIPDDLSDLALLADQHDPIGDYLALLAKALHRFHTELKGIPDKNWYVQTWFTNHLKAAMFDERTIIMCDHDED